MKRCPECDFLYYDEQDHCDIDGTRLRFTTKLSVPADAAQKKALRVTLTSLVMATIILAVVLFIFYPPEWHTSTSSPPSAVRPASVRAANTNTQPAPPEAPEAHIPSTPSPRPPA